MEKKFDHLLNEKCSWSYKSQKVISTSNAKISEDPALQVQSAIMTVQAQNKYDEEFNGTVSETNLSFMENENWLENNIDRIEADETSITESTGKIANKQPHQQKIMEKNIFKRKLHNKILDDNTMQITLPNSSIKLQKTVKCTENMSSSSSDNEVLQTRFSLSNDNFNKKNEENIDDNCTILRESDVEKLTYKKNNLKNYINMKRKSPIIIQAVAYNKESNTVNKAIAIQNTAEAEKIKTMSKNESYIDSKQMHSSYVLTKKLDSVSADSLSVEVNTPNTEIGSGSVQLVNTNDSRLFISKTINTPQYNTDKEIFEQTLLANINDTSVDQNVEEPGVVSDDIIQTFFDGSFDVNVYKPDEILPNKNIKKHQLNLALCTESNQIITEIPSIEFSNIHISEKNIFNKRKMHRPHNGQKKYKQSDTENSDKSEHFTRISSQSLKMRELNDKKIKVTKQSQTIKKRPCKNVRKKDESFGLEDSNLEADKTPVRKITDTTLQVSLMNDSSLPKSDKIINSTHSVDSYSCETETIVNENKKVNSLRKNKNKSKSNTFQKNDTFVIPRRNTRNSSLIALKKIKEIEKFENLFDNKEEIYADSEQEEDYTSLLGNKTQNKDKSFFELKEQTEKEKENSKKYYTKNLNGYGKGNVNDFNYNEVKKYNSDENASIIIMHNEIECTKKSAESNKKHKEILSSTKLKTRNAITNKYAIKRNRNKSINTKFEANFTDELNFEDTQEKFNVPSELHSGRERGQSKEFENLENEILDYYIDVSNKDLTNKNCATECKKSVTQCRRKTWDDLENELLREFDSETVGSEENVSKTLIVKEKQLIRKKGVDKDENLLTVSNTSMTQMINKSRSGGKYNMRYEIQNTKSKYMESIPNINKFQNVNSILKGAISKSTSMCILEKAISAMEKCTAGFIIPQINTTQIEWTNSPLQNAEMPRSFDTKDETQQSHANLIYTAKENDQCTSNKKISYKMRARNRREKNSLNKNALQISNDYDALLQKNDGNKTSDADHLHNMSMKCNSIFNENVDKNKSNSVSKVLKVCSGKTNNPWDDLLIKLNLEQNAHSANRIHEHEYNVRKLRQKDSSKKSTINLKRYNTRSKKLLVITDLGQEAESYNDVITNVEERKYEEYESLKSSHENEPILLTHGKKEWNSLNIASNLNLADNAADTECEKVVNITEKIKPTRANREDTKKKSNLEQFEGKKKNIQGVSTIAKDKKCQKYKINMKDGDLKLKRHSSESSEGSDNSKDFAELKENCSKNLKNNKHTKAKTKKDREKYNSYLKKLFEQGDEKNITDNENVANTQDNKIANHSNLKIFDKNPNTIWIRNEKENVKKLRIIAEEDEDIFSISSSDSEASNKKSSGSGLLCDFFDE